MWWVIAYFVVGALLGYTEIEDDLHSSGMTKFEKDDYKMLGLYTTLWLPGLLFVVASALISKVVAIFRQL